MMTFTFGTATQISYALYPIVIISFLLTLFMCGLVYKIFGLPRWMVLVAGVLLLTASTSFSVFNLSTMFYRLTLQPQQVLLDFAVPHVHQQPFDVTLIRYVDAITPNPKQDLCHVVLEDTQGMLYQSLDIDVSRCQAIQQQLMLNLQLKPRPPKPKSSHSPPPLPTHVK